MKKTGSNPKIRNLFIVLCALCFMLHASSPLSVDWASFHYDNNLALVEIYYALPYNTFHYQVNNDTVSARYKLNFLLKSINSSDSLVDSSYHRAVIPSFQKAQDQDMKLVDGFGVFARTGKYWFNLTIEESNFSHTIIDTITVPDFTLEPDLSDIELASLAFRDTTGGKFTKGNMRIIPNPDLKFGQSYELMYVYLEGYNLVMDTNSYKLTYQVFATADSLVKSYPAEIRPKTGKSFAYTFALNTQGFAPKNYFLELTLTDLSNNKSVTKTKPFTVIEKPAAVLTGFNMQTANDTSVFYTEIRYLALPSEINQYNSLNEEGKKEFLRRFWLKKDFSGFVERISYVDTKYAMGKITGRNTDRGRIYIKYGAPDEIVVHSVIEHIKPHEHWYYYNRGIHFIFSDIRSNNNYQLIYSNIDEEPKNPNWEKYVDPLELDELN